MANRQATPRHRHHANPGNFTEDDIEELDVYFKWETRTQLANGGIEIIDWYPLEFLRLNGTTCLHMSYSRAGEDSETTRVNVCTPSPATTSSSA